MATAEEYDHDSTEQAAAAADLSRAAVVWTLVVVNLAGIMERADEALLPGVYREIGVTLHASPTSLGSLTLLRSFVQILCFPIAAYLSIRHNRATVIAMGALMWSAATFGVGVSSSFVQVAVSRALNGIGLAIVIPAIQSMVADISPPHQRGLAFGWLQFTSNFGSIFGNVFSVLLAGTTVLGIAGWRASFHIIGLLSVLVAILVHRYAVDPRFLDKTRMLKECDNIKTTLTTLKESLDDAKKVVKIPTFQAIVAQGVSGTFPWAALSFAPMWLELIGFSHQTTAILIGLFSASGSLGGLFGGWLGDKLAWYLPNTGRIILAQFSSGIGIPFGAILLLLLPYDSSTSISHGFVFFTMGFLMSWCATATNNPIFAEIVLEKSRTSIYALDRSFESILSSFAPPIVGLMAEHVFGYRISSNNHEPTSIVDQQNAKALGKALYVAFGIPYAICCVLYSILYWTYPKDREKAQLESSQVEQHHDMSTTVGFYNLKPGYVKLNKDFHEQHSTTIESKVQLSTLSPDPKNVEEKIHILSQTR